MRDDNTCTSSIEIRLDRFVESINKVQDAKILAMFCPQMLRGSY
jgi:hypothetical protein